jgi:molybdenum cofactor synthesis domain-containing protein
MTGRVAALCTSAQKGRRKDAQVGAVFDVQSGLHGDAHAGTWHRQVSLLSVEDVGRFKAKSGLPITAGAFGENLLTAGVDLNALGLGSRLRVGADVQLAVTQLGKTCHERCAIYYQAGDCIMPRRGLFARVLSGGAVSVGDLVRIETLVPRELFQVVVLTVSDRCSRGEAHDTAGPAVGVLLAETGDCHVYAHEILPDDRNRLSERLRHYCDGHSIDLVVAVGGTGFSPRDVTPEAVRDVVERFTPGLDEAMRASSAAKSPFAMLSRAVSGIRGSTLVVSLPGSEKAATENLLSIVPGLAHGLAKLRGDPSDCGRQSVSAQVRKTAPVLAE